MTPQISSRARQMPASPIRKLMPLAEDAKRRGTHVHHLNIGQPDLETPAPMRERLAACRDRVFAYSPSGGTPEYLATLLDYYGRLGIRLGLKDLIACGIRLGCLVTRNREVTQSCTRMAQGRLSPPGLAQVVALGARQLGPEYTASVVSEYQKRRDILFAGLTAVPGVFLRKPEGAFYFIARLPVRDSEDFARWMLTDYEREGATVMLAPAQGFYATPGLGRNEVRIAYVLERRLLEDAVGILADGLTAYRTARRLEALALEQAREEDEPDFSVPVEG